MNEAEWLAADDPDAMLRSLRDRGRANDRKLRLFICAGCRQPWAATEHADRAALDVAERFADGRADEQHLAEARRGLRSGHARHGWGSYDVERAVSLAVAISPDLAAEAAADSLRVVAYWSGRAGYDRASIESRYAAREAERTRQTAAVRCIFGNPFRRAAISAAWLVWNDGTVRRLAEAIYAERAFERLPILADALEEAGCDDAEILGHCRGPAPHTRGCWVVDLLLDRG